MPAGFRRKPWCAALLLAPGFAAAAWGAPINPAVVDPAAAPKPTGKITVISTRPLVFGRFVAGTGGSITIAPTGARTRAGGVIVMPSSASSSAGFLVTETKTGVIPNVVILTLPANSGITLRSGTNSMALSGFTSDRSILSSLLNGSLPVSIGATLTVRADQPRGQYTGAIPLTVEYQ